MDNVEIVKTLVHHVRQSFLDVMENVDQDVADWLPPGEAHPIRMSNLHCLWAEDRFINVFLQEDPTIWSVIGLEEKTGLIPGRLPSAEWARSTPIDINQLREVYMPALFEGTDKYLDTLKADDLDKPVKSDVTNLNGLKAGEILIRFALHNANHVGEIASQKGTQGLQGYSF
tara:strand:+ start:36928 stop:37443 length:516 start_codon:yes stop_codon:yes gene_type:complete